MDPAATGHPIRGAPCYLPHPHPSEQDPRFTQFWIQDRIAEWHKGPADAFNDRTPPPGGATAHQWAYTYTHCTSLKSAVTSEPDLPTQLCFPHVWPCLRVTTLLPLPSATTARLSRTVTRALTLCAPLKLSLLDHRLIDCCQLIALTDCWLGRQARATR